MKPYTIQQSGYSDNLTRQANGSYLSSQTVDLSYVRTLTCSSLIKGNWKAPNPWAYDWVSQSNVRGTYRYTSGGRLFTQRVGLLGSTTIPNYGGVANSYTSAYNQALSKLTEKVRGSLDLATSLAESGQTVKMLNLVKRLTDTLRDMKKSWKREILDQLRAWKSKRSVERGLRRWQKGLALRHPSTYRPRRTPKGLGRRIAQSSSAAANGWLEYTYGVKPLINDIHDVAENIVGMARNCDAIKVVGSAVINDRATLSAGTFLGIPITGERVTYEGFVQVMFKVRLRPAYDVDLAAWSSLNPVSVAWELMPYSFVIDWVFDVGSYLRNLETALLSDNRFLDGSVSVLTKYSTTVMLQKRYQTGTDVYDIAAQAVGERCNFGRTVLNSYPRPYIPSFRVDLGASRLLSAAALLRQLLK